MKVSFVHPLGFPRTNFQARRRPKTGALRLIHGLERLEQRLAPAGIVNGDFAIANPADPGFGWSLQGNASIAGNAGILDEGTTVETQFSQTFAIAPGTQVLRFTIVASDLVGNGQSNPPDAFEAALLDATTLDPLVGPPTGLTKTDSFLNIQQTGQVFYAPQVTVQGAGPSGSVASLPFPTVVSVDVSQVPANTEATVYFDLLGFSPVASSVQIAYVAALQSITTPTAYDQTVSIPEDTARPITLGGADPDVPPLPLSYSVTTAPAHGTLSGTAPNLTYTPVAGYLGADSFQFTASNGTATSPPGVVSINVAATPTANPQTVTTAEGSAAPITLSGTDPDSPPLPLTYSITTAPTHGMLTGTAPDLTYTPDAGYFGPDGFQFATNNGTATSPGATVSIDVVGTPAATDQSLSTGEGAALPIVLTGSDPNTPPLPLGYTVTAAPSHGSLTGTAPDLLYTPDSGYFGPDSLQFTVGNGTATSAPATVSIRVGSPTADAQSLTTAEDTARAITLTGSDPNTPPLPITYAVTVSPSHGLLTGTAPDLTYTPNTGYFGPDSFQFTANNGAAASAPATVSIDVVGQPAAGTQAVTAAQDTPTAITITGSDPDSPPLPLTFAVTVNPGHGMLTGSAPHLTYTPAPGYFGLDSFQFTTSNGTLTSDLATVSIDVVGKPAADSQSVTTAEGTVVPITLTGSDPDEPPLPLNFSVTAGPAHGALTGTAPNLSYKPDAGYFGPDSFQFTAGNGTATSAAAAVSIVVVGTPASKDQSLTTGEGVALPIALTGTDPNTPPLPLTFTVTVSPVHGVLSGTAPDLIYTPDSGYIGLDSFQFTASNSSATSPPATISIGIGTPTAHAQSVTTAENTAAPIALTGTDPNSPPLPLTFVVTAGPAHGTLGGSAPNLTYTPAVGYLGPDSFQFTAGNGTVTSPAATVAITVVGIPTAVSQPVTTAENTAAPVTLTGTDPNSPPLPLTFVVTAGPAHGTLSGSAPDLTYTPASGYFGPDSFQFTAGNGTATSAAAMVSVDVVGIPTAVSPSVTTAENTTAPIILVASDPNTPPLPLTFVVTAGPAHGTLSGSAPDLSYTPATGYFGPDSFQFTAGNGTATSAAAMVSVDVIGIPAAASQSVTTREDTATAITLAGSDPDSPPRSLVFTVTSGPAHGTIAGTAPDLTYTPAAGYSGVDQFTFYVGNGASQSGVAMVSLTITPAASQAPVTVGSSYSTIQNHPFSVSAPGVLAGVVSSGPTAPTAVLVSGPAHGTVVVDPDGAFTYNPSANYHGTDSFTFRADAGAAMGNVSVVSLTVTPIPVRLLPDTAYYNYVRRRRDIDPARFDTYHPRIGAILRLEDGGIPTSPTILVSVNHHFDATALRAQYRRDASAFDREDPVLGALFRLESPGNGPAPSRLLPDTAHFDALRELYAENPDQFDRRQAYVGALFAVEDLEDGAAPAASTAGPGATKITVKTGSAHPVPAWRASSSPGGMLRPRLTASLARPPLGR